MHIRSIYDTYIKITVYLLYHTDTGVPTLQKHVSSHSSRHVPILSTLHQSEDTQILSPLKDLSE